MKVKELLDTINGFAPFFLQESYDNSGLQFGDLDADINKIAISLEATKQSMDFAIKNGANVLLTHHPILFFSIKSIVKQEKPFLYKAMSNGLNLIAAHTNFDAAENGLNDYVGSLLGIKKLGPIQPASERIFKFSFYVPYSHAETVKNAVFSAGAGVIGNYDRTSFNVEGEGTFRPLENANPYIGKKGEVAHVREIKVETVVRERNLQNAINALLSSHPYEEPAYDIYELKLKNRFGIGMIGEIEKPMLLEEFANFVKKKLQARYVCIVKTGETKINRVALCTGTGSSLLESVSRAGIDLFITGDITYHTAVRAKELNVNVLDVEHFDTEKFFKEAMYKQLVNNGIDKNILLVFNGENSPFTLI
jgi:dinuclear metal center YbgI/SA1388 family protein